MKIRGRRDMSLMMSSDTKTWTTAGTGVQIPVMAWFGSPRPMQGGRLMVTVIGPGLILGDGLGLMTNLGAKLRFTTVAGCRLDHTGGGCRDQWRWRRF